MSRDITPTSPVTLTDLVASYPGDADFAGSDSDSASHSVDTADTTITITNASSLASTDTLIGQSYTVQWSVDVTGPGAGAPTGTVSITGGGGCSADISVGQCSVTTDTAGLVSLVAHYPGDTGFSGSTSPPLTQVVNRH